MPFGGETYDRDQDSERLLTQLYAVRDFMFARRGEWFTLEQLERALGFPQASVSARLRDLRKPRFGEWEVLRERVEGGNGLHRYMVTGEHGEARGVPCVRCRELEAENAELRAEVARLRQEVDRLRASVRRYKAQADQQRMPF